MFKLCTFLRSTPVQPTKYIIRTVFVTRNRKTETTQTKDTQSNDEFRPIFQFPHMRILVLLNRIKVYQMIAAGTCVPVTGTLTHFNYMDLNTAFAICGFAAVSSLPFYGLSYFCKNIVGFVYTNQDSSKTKLAYLDYWGKRADIIVDTDDIIPFSEQPTSFTDSLYYSICRYSTKDKLKINLRLGKVLDYDRFSKIFSKAAYD